VKLSIGNIDPVFAELLRLVQENLDAQFREKVAAIFRTLVVYTPQWSGDLASNWQMNLTGQATYLRWAGKVEWTPEVAKRGPFFSMGLTPASDYALKQAQTLEYHYTQSVFLVNATPLTLAAKTVTSDSDGKTKNLRPENLINGGKALIAFVKGEYS